jgi:hypothetical protein
VKILDGSRAHIRDFLDVAGAKESAQEIVEAMQARYPNHGNLTTLVYSATETVKRRSSFQSSPVSAPPGIGLR